MGTIRVGNMRIIARKTLVQFWIKNPNSKASLETWFKETERADRNTCRIQ